MTSKFDLLKTHSESVSVILTIPLRSAVYMNWLDSVYPPDADPSAPGVARGRCDPEAGVPETVEAAHPDAYVVYSNIKIGAINSTFSAV
jgi:cellulose 1,4-beta-cellobiosidase